MKKVIDLGLGIAFLVGGFAVQPETVLRTLIGIMFFIFSLGFLWAFDEKPEPSQPETNK